MSRTAAVPNDEYIAPGEDTLTRAGAETLRYRIIEYWAAIGVRIDCRVEHDVHGWVVRSNIRGSEAPMRRRAG